MPDKIDVHENSAEKIKKQLRFTKSIMSATGYILILASVAIFGLMAYQNFKGIFVILRYEEDQPILVWFLNSYGNPLMIFVSGIFLAVIGIRMLGSAGRGEPSIIISEDRELLEPLISSAKKDAIQQYVVLASLSGFTGAFQKIGFTGLPLATVVLTLIFSALSFFDEPQFLELAKLTTGAFIGSFVQKGVDAVKLP